MNKKAKKWQFAIGTTSRVPYSGGLHYLIADFDTHELKHIKLERLGGNIFFQKTEHGWHMYTDTVMPFYALCQSLENLGADPSWIRIGRDRGYFFLADKSMTVFPWPVERMVLYIDKEKTHNTKEA